MSNQKIKKIVSVFLKTQPDKIMNDTVIDTSVIQGSVLFHRMIARINDSMNIEIENYDKIHTFQDLLDQIKLKQ